MRRKETNKRLLSIVLAVAILLAGVNISPNTKSAKAASYSYTYSSNISERKVDVVDGVTTLTVAGSTYTLTLRLTADDAACDQYGTCWIRYKNGAIYFASYELEGKSMVKHRFYSNGQAVYANKLLFKGSNSYMATHYEYNGVEYELPNVETLRKLLNISDSTPTQSPTVNPVPTVQPTMIPTVNPIPTVQPTMIPTENPIPTVLPTMIPTKNPVPTVQPTAIPTVNPNPTVTNNPSQDVTKIDFDFWWKQFLSGTITWEQFSNIVGKYQWTTQQEWEETSVTYYVYNPDGTIAYTTTITTGTGKGNGTGSSDQQGGSAGTAKVDVNATGNGGGTATASAISGSKSKNSSKCKAHVKVSGSKIEWITASGKTKTVFFIKKNGKFKHREIKGKNVVASGYIKELNCIFIRLKNGNGYTISLKNHKVKKVKGVCYKAFRKQSGFIKSILIKQKSGGYKKVSVKKLKFTKGTYRKTINK